MSVNRKLTVPDGIAVEVSPSESGVGLSLAVLCPLFALARGPAKHKGPRLWRGPEYDVKDV